MKVIRLSDYQALRFEEPIPKMDVVFDTVGGETLQRSWGVLKPGGRMITIAADSEATTDDRVKQAFFIVEPNREQLSRIGTCSMWAISGWSWMPCCRSLKRPWLTRAEQGKGAAARCCRSAGRCYRKKLICPLYDRHR
jgi:NADPH:quinone reductase-like Zn-dependent oxidoreductase